jgi:hypothetical protein
MRLGIECEITSDIALFNNSNKEVKINYSNKEIDSSLQIIPEGLLFESSIRKDKPVLSYKETTPVIFSNNSSLGFDILSAIFWFISRYEEYMHYTPDMHNRFSAKESFCYSNDILDRPIVDEWVMLFRDSLLQQSDKLIFKQASFKYITTIDVDSPWCYKNKGFFRNTVGLLRDVAKRNFKYVILRLRVLMDLAEDPWYKFSWLLNLHKNTDIQILFFVHMGNFGKYDKTVSYKTKTFRRFIDEIGSKHQLFIHPSYMASNNIELLKKEIGRLSSLLKKRVEKSRQHYLKILLPDYYRMLIEVGIKEDYTMGYADKPGFRAGTSNKFYFFDLKKNRATKLMINPFVVMDRTLKSYENTSYDEAVAKIKYLIDNVKKTDGTFISLWHNESLSNEFEWKGWSSVFEQMVEYLNPNYS